jgi:hypothetical protein
LRPFKVMNPVPSNVTSRAASLLTVVAALLFATPITAEGESETELAKETQHPVSDLISVPFQNNTSYNFGPRERTLNVLNIQPVLPLELNEDWNLITRTIIPIVSSPPMMSGQDRKTGIGDIQFSAFLSPVKTVGGWWLAGAGPVLSIPTA